MLKENEIFNIDEYDVLGLAQILLPKDERIFSSIRRKKGGRNDWLYLRITEEILEKCQMNLLAFALIPIPKSSQKRDGSSSTIGRGTEVAQRKTSTKKDKG